MQSVDILIIDDDKDLSLLVKSMLMSAGFSVETLDNGKRALQLLRQRHLETRLILLDIEMPHMSGYEVCEELQDDPRLALIPIIMITASMQAENRLQAFQLGAVGFLNKPLTQDILLEQVQKAIDVEKQWRSSFVPQAGPPAAAPAAVPPAIPPETAQPLQTDPPAAQSSEKALIKHTAQPLVSTQEEATNASDLSIHISLSHPRQDASLVPRPVAQKKKNVGDRASFASFVKFLSASFPEEVLNDLKPDNVYEQLELLGVTPNQTAGIVSTFTGLPFLTEVKGHRLRPGVLPLPFCRKYNVVPFENEDGQLSFAFTHPFQMEVQDTLVNYRNAPQYIAVPSILQRLFQQEKNTPSPGSSTSAKTAQSTPKQRANEMEDLMDELQSQYIVDTQKMATENVDLEDPSSAPMIRLVNRLIEEAYTLKASDIHIEAREEHVRVRFRVDGVLKDYHHLKPANLIQPLAARLKIMAQLNITERRLPQDGRIVFKEFNRKNLDFDLRVSTAPMNHGEKIVMRILDKQKSMLPLESLGFSEYNLRRYREALRNPYGMILHVGPTGSGKSMTLYSALNEINTPDINVQTAEDPIEYTLPNINQLQVQPEIGLTFARALRAYLRQDPDVILVGEIRDHETAHIAVEAALTGHLLLSTLHTNDAASTLTRFIEMGISPFMISPSVLMICAQRLIRRLCTACKTPYTASELERKQTGHVSSTPLTLYQANGCAQCNQSGYQGRTGIHELLIPDEAIRNAITEPGISAEALKKMAISQGMITLYWDAMEKVKRGETALQEALSKVKPD